MPRNYPDLSNPTQIASTFIHGDNVIYGLIYENDGNGSNKVKLLINPLYQAETYEYDMGFSISDEFKDQVSLALVKHSPETDKIAIVLPEEATNKQEKKYIKGLSFNTYEINLSISGPVVKQLDTVALQKNINSKSFANEGNSYFQPKATQIEGGIVVIANNLKKKTAVAWYLKPNRNGEFSALAGDVGTIERNLFKLNDKNSEFALNRNTLLHSQTNKKIVGNKIVEITDILISNMTEVVKSIKRGKGINEYLLNPNHQTLLFSSENKISFLRYMAQNKKFAFLESNTLHIRSLNNIDAKPPVYEFQSPIEQLYIEENDQGDIIAAAVNKQNIIAIHVDHSTELKATITPIDSVQNLRDFIKVINGQLLPDIASSTTVTSIPTSTTAKKRSTQAEIIQSTAASTKQLTTPTPGTTSKRSAATTIATEQFTTPTPGTTSKRSAATTIATEQFTTPISSTTSKSTAARTKHDIIPTQQIYTISDQSTAVSHEAFTQQTYTIADEFTSRSPLRFGVAGISRSSNNIGTIAGSTLGALSVGGLLIFIIYQYYRRGRNASESISELNSLELSSMELASNECSGDEEGEVIVFNRRVLKNRVLVDDLSKSTLLNEVSVDSSNSQSTSNNNSLQDISSLSTDPSDTIQKDPSQSMIEVFVDDFSNKSRTSSTSSSI